MNRPMDRSPEWTGAQMALRISGRRREAQVGSSWGVEDLVPTSDLSGSEASSGPGARCLGRLRATSAGLDLGPKLVRNLSRCTAQTRRYRVRDSKSHQRVKESSTRTVVCSKMEVLEFLYACSRHTYCLYSCSLLEVLYSCIHPPDLLLKVRCGCPDLPQTNDPPTPTAALARGGSGSGQQLWVERQEVPQSKRFGSHLARCSASRWTAWRG